jgi:AmmeMemoRadiSam system protein A
MPLPLSSDDRRQLLRLARTTLTEVILYKRIPDVPVLGDRAAEPGRAFVTLYYRGQLRGCVGMSGDNLPLSETVVQAAVGAAMNDPRFEAVTCQELPEVEIEISVLSAPQPVLAGAVEVGRQGLLVSRGKNRGLLLPKVATERSWPAERFLEETCRKAGLPADAWRDPETQLLAFTADVFSERDFPAVTIGAAEDRSPSTTPELKE